MAGIAKAGAIALFAVYFFLDNMWWHVHFAPVIGHDHDGALPTASPALWILLACYLPLLGVLPINFCRRSGLTGK